MDKYETKMLLKADALAEAQKAHSKTVGEFLKPRKLPANVVGMGVGVKWKNGQPTGEPALVVLVTHKVPREQLGESDMVPLKLQDMQTDVLAIGYPFAEGSEPPDTGARTLTGRVRPAKGGCSVGHHKITAGTIGTCVYDLLPEGSNSPSGQGIGIPSKYYILSNNHVLANSNNAAAGDPILQPGPYDGGSDPADRIAVLSRFIPITLDPPVNREQHNNLVDAAIAEGQFIDLDREIYWIGHVRGWRLKADVNVGTLIKKTGRTTNFTTGRITAVSATVDVGYGGGKVARFKDQIVTTNFSDGGDSGSLVTTLDNVAVGLLFAGSAKATILNQIENVRSLLGVEVAEESL